MRARNFLWQDGQVAPTTPESTIIQWCDHLTFYTENCLTNPREAGLKLQDPHPGRHDVRLMDVKAIKRVWARASREKSTLGYRLCRLGIGMVGNTSSAFR